MIIIHEVGHMGLCYMNLQEPGGETWWIISVASWWRDDLGCHGNETLSAADATRAS